MDQNFERCNGNVPLTDDIQVLGTDDNHDMHLHEAMERFKSTGIKLNFDKCVIKSKSCTFFGNVYTPGKVRSDPKKV